MACVPEIDLFYDGAEISQYYDRVKGFTTNSSILRSHGVSDLLAYAREAVQAARCKPISFQLPSLEDVEAAVSLARALGSLGDNVYVKVPVVNERGELTTELLRAVQAAGTKLNVTAVFTARHVDAIREFSETSGAPAIVSIFAGKISDTGRDPREVLSYARRKLPDSKILWAGCRSVYDYCTAARSGADIVTVPVAVLERMRCLDVPLEELAAQTVNQFLVDGSM